jgi:AraC-like DNA-binding protein/mannose-6-phosphate isomerase-like protein (cupin superfamily)
MREAMAEYKIADENIELLNRRAASSLRYYMLMHEDILPFELTSFHYSPFQYWLNNPWHMHSHFEMQYLFHGKAEWVTKARNIELMPGQIMIIPNKLLHHRNGIIDKAQMMGLHFLMPEDYCNHPKFNEFRDLIYEKDQILDIPEDLRKKIELLPEILLSDQTFREQHAAVLLAEILLEIFKLFFPSILAIGDHIRENRTGTHDFQDQVYHTALKYVNDNLNKSISANDVARTCGVSPRHLNRIFVQYGGITLGKHIIRRRIDKSFNLLIKTDAPLEEIAGRLGFSDAAHFIRTFQKSTGITPGEYRKRLPEQE